MSTKEVAKGLVELCRKGDFEGAIKAYYSPEIVSVEPFDMNGMPRTAKGIDAVMKKTQWWAENHEVHGCEVSDPFISLDKFAVIFDLDVTFKPAKKRSQMKEVAVYTVAGGKIVHEEFLYGGVPGEK